MAQNHSYVPFLDGDKGFYTSSPSFYKMGHICLTLRESYGLKAEREVEGEQRQTETNLNLGYTLFPLLELRTGVNYLDMKDEDSKGAFLKTKLPFLSISRMKSSVSPSITFTKGKKPYFTVNFDIAIIPFKQTTLPRFLFGQSINIGKREEMLFQYSSLISLDSKPFQPFIEFYTEFNKNISRSSMNKTLLCSGLGYNFGNFGLRGGVEIGLGEESKRWFDYRFTGGINYSFNTRRKPMGKLFITVVDKETEKPITATIILKGNEERILECKKGKCVIENLILGIYTIEIKNPDYERLRMPIFVKEKPIMKTYKLTKKYEKKGGGSQ